jgi:hypothetical protein
VPQLEDISRILQVGMTSRSYVAAGLALTGCVLQRGPDLMSPMKSLTELRLGLTSAGVVLRA